jgi:hypothetical protein
MHERVSLQKTWPMSLYFKQFPSGSRCDAIFTVWVIGIMASPPPSHNHPSRSKTS